MTAGNGRASVRREELVPYPGESESWRDRLYCPSHPRGGAAV